MRHHSFWSHEVEPVDRTRFDAELRRKSLGPLSICKASLPAATLERTSRHIARSEGRRLALLMSLDGRARVSHCGRRIVLDRGDYTLCDSLLPVSLTFEEPSEAIAVSVAPETLTLYLPDPDSVCGLHMSGSRGLGGTAHVLLRSLWAQLECGVPAAVADTLARALLQVIASSYGALQAASAESATGGARRIEIRRFIEARLRDPGLSAAAVAAAFGISPRYVRKLFAGEPESVSAYILRRRLEECARQLADPLWHGHTVTETAFDWGFDSMPYFTRVFRGRSVPRRPSTGIGEECTSPRRSSEERLMPTYIYRCKKCGEQFECIEHISEHGSIRPKCPKCGEKQVESVVAPFFAKTSRKS